MKKIKLVTENSKTVQELTNKYICAGKTRQAAIRRARKDVKEKFIPTCKILNSYF